MAKSDSKKYKSLIKIIKTAFSDLGQCEKIDLKGSYRLPDKKIQFPLDNYPLQLNIGEEAHVLHLYPEPSLNPAEQGDEPNYILFNPDKYFSHLSGFYRLKDGDKVTLGHGNQQQRDFLKTPKKLPERQLSISNHEGKLTFKCHHPETGSCIAPLFKEKKMNKVIEWRKKKVSRLAKLFPDLNKKFNPKEALKLIREVNLVMESEVYREKNNHGKPGGVLAIPDKMNAIIIGDLHTRIDNLLTLLSQNNFLEAIEQEKACLIVLGDAVHPEEDGHYDEMQSSQQIMDILFQLKLRFPKQFFYLRGNHDSFSEELSKKGVPQGLLWAKQLNKERGKAYKKEMQRYYDCLPYLAYSKHFIACHAAAPSSAVNLHALINIHKYPQFINELINKRIKTPNRMTGYTKGDVKKFRSALKAHESTPFIVGHTPLDLEETIWEDVGGVNQHYIVHAAHQDWVGAMVQIENSMYAMRYPVESISDYLKKS